jgi:hypothetical protein
MNQEIWSRCGMKVGFRASFKIDEFVKSRQETMFVTYHEGHEEHEAEIIKYFLALRVLRALRGENRTFYGFIKKFKEMYPSDFTVKIKITIELLADHKPDALQRGLIKSDRIH